MRTSTYFEDSGFDAFLYVTSAHLEEIREGNGIWRGTGSFSKKGHI